MSLVLYLFGFPRHRTRGRLDTTKPTALLLYLAATGNWVSRSTLATLLWETYTESKAKASLRQALHSLKKNWPEHLEVESERVRLCIDTDLDAFKEKLEQADFEAVARLGADPFFGHYQSGLEAFDEWLGLERYTLDVIWRDAVIRFAETATAKNYSDAFELLYKVLERDPLAEEALQKLLTLAQLTDAKTSAMGAFERFRATLKSELDLEPMEETRALLETLKQTSSRPLVTNHQGKALTPFVGRERELELLKSLVHENRLVTILGQGGVGKTRLALQLLSLEQNNFKNGATFVGLSAARSNNDALYQTIRSLEIGTSSSDAQRDLLSFLQDKELLLVLDNAEHLAGLAPQLNDWLQAAPGLSILLTSRVKLNVQLEQVFLLGGLAMPEDTNSSTFETSDAVQFFLRTAKRLDSSFLFSKSDRGQVLTICKRLEALPLGLELAASWLSVMTLAEIAAELTKSFDFLESSMSDLPERQQSLAAVFDYSWQLLSPKEQNALAAMSIFEAGFTQTALGAVTKASRKDVLVLIHKSLLTRVQAGRFDLHAVVKQYARRHVSKAEHSTLLTAHRQYYFKLLLNCATHLQSKEVQQALNVMSADLANIKKAYGQTFAHEKTEALHKASWALRRFFELRARFAEGIDFFEASLQHSKSDAQRALLMSLQAWLYQCAGHYDEAIKRAELSLEHEQSGPVQLAAWQALGASQMRLGRFSQAQQAFETGLTVAQRIADTNAAASLKSNLGLLHQRLADYDQALSYMQSSLATFRQLEDDASITTLLNNIADVLLSLEQPKEALVLLDEGAQLAKDGEFSRFYPYLLFNKGRAYTLLQETNKAVAPLAEALKYAQDNQDPYLEAWVEQALGQAKQDANPDEAQTHLLQSLRIAHQTDHSPLALDNLLILAKTLRESNPGLAAELCSYVRKHPQSLESDRIEAEALLAQLPRSSNLLHGKSLTDVIRQLEQAINAARPA